MSRIRAISLVSGIYDGLIGIALLTAKPLFAQLFAVPLPQPPIHADLNGVFLLAIAIGYAIPYRDPVRGRSYLWVMGPLLKGAGALTFVLDYLFRHSPASFLLFAVSDAIIGALTLWALVSVTGRQSPVASGQPSVASQQSSVGGGR